MSRKCPVNLFHVLSPAMLVVSLPASTVLLGLIASQGVTADSPVWSRTFGPTNAGCGQSVQQTSDEGYILAGGTYSPSSSSGSAALLIKTDSNGNRLWERTFDEACSDASFSAQQTFDGGYILAGAREPLGGVRNAWLIKTDSNGNKLWEKTFGGSIDNEGRCVRQTSDGGYVIVGFINRGYPPNVWLIKTDSNGNELWDRTLGGSNYASGWAVQQTLDGGYIIAGEIAIPHSGNAGEPLLMKTDSSGSMLWFNHFNYGPSDDIATSVLQTFDGEYVIAGATLNGPNGGDDVFLIKADSSGNKLWDKTYGGTNTDDGACVDETSDGGYVIAGNTASFGAGQQDVWLIRTDSNGNNLWDNTYGGTEGDGGTAVQQTSDGGYIVAGYTTSFGNGGDDFWLIKTDSLGNSEVPSPNTPVGSPVTVHLVNDNVTATFSNVTVAGYTSYTSKQGNPGGQIPSGFMLRGQFVDIITTATYGGPITIGITYDNSTPKAQNLKLFHWYGGHWDDVTTSVDTTNHIVYGRVNSLSWFFIGGEWVWVDDGAHSAPVFPNIYIGIGAALGAGIVAYAVRRRLAAR